MSSKADRRKFVDLFFAEIVGEPSVEDMMQGISELLTDLSEDQVRAIWLIMKGDDKQAKLFAESDKTATAIVKAIIGDLNDRRGLRQAWEGIDNETQREIRSAWKMIILRQGQKK